MTNNEMALMANIAVDMQKNEVNAVLDKIRDEIEQKIKKRPGLNHSRMERERNDAFLETLDIIDKYSKEQEE